MKKTTRFTVRITPEEKTMFEELAQKLKRSQSYVVRMVIREVLVAMKEDEKSQISPIVS